MYHVQYNSDPSIAYVGYIPLNRQQKYFLNIIMFCVEKKTIKSEGWKVCEAIKEYCIIIIDSR